MALGVLRGALTLFDDCVLTPPPQKKNIKEWLLYVLGVITPCLQAAGDGFSEGAVCVCRASVVISHSGLQFQSPLKAALKEQGL